jgi:hypothetical protein
VRRIPCSFPALLPTSMLVWHLTYDHNALSSKGFHFWSASTVGALIKNTTEARCFTLFWFTFA